MTAGTATLHAPPRCLVIGIDNHVGAYLARLLDARGFGAAGGIGGVGDSRLAVRLGIADALAPVAASDAAAAAAAARLVFLVNDGSSACADLAGDIIAAATATSQPPRLIHVADIADMGETSVRETIARIAAVRQTPAANILLDAHDSRLGHPETLTAKIVAAAYTAGRNGAGVAQQRLQVVETGPRDWGWTPEYVDAVARLALHDRLFDAVIASGHRLTTADIAAHAFDFFRQNVGDHIEILGTGDVTAGRDPAPLSAAIGWRATTYGRDFVRALCEGAGDAA